MTDVRPVGVSKTLFVIGLVAAIFASSLLSLMAATQLPMLKGPKGDAGPSMIPFATAQPGPPYPQTSSLLPTWQDMTLVLTTITVDQTSRLVIAFSADLVGQADSGPTFLFIRALVNGTAANPYKYNSTMGARALEMNPVGPMTTYSCVFWDEVSTGTYTVKIQWALGTSGATTPTAVAVATLPCLMVFALPKQ